MRQILLLGNDLGRTAIIFAPMKPDLNINDFTYALPENRIAKYPLSKRDDSKLLIYESGEIVDAAFKKVAQALPIDTTLIFNNTKVVQARLFFEKTAGSKPIEVFCLEPKDTDVQAAMALRGSVTFECLVGNAKRWKDGLTLSMALGKGNTLKAQKAGRSGDAFYVQFSWNTEHTFAEILEMVGKVPLPPYLNRASEVGDKQRYQTVYARFEGSVAAPTAGLHFTKQILMQLDEKGVKRLETTLHVGAGTFKPVSTAYVKDHAMHAEEIHVTRNLIEALLAKSGALIAVGTTSTRTIESLYWLGVKALHGDIGDGGVLKLNQWEAYELPQNIAVKTALNALIKYMVSSKVDKLVTYTSLIIAPGYKFRMLDGLFTNFHQPGSTLVLLIAAILGEDWKRVYKHAINHNYRFLSYGDSNLYWIPNDKKANI